MAARDFKISRDPDFGKKVRDVVSLYVDPPEGEVVVSVDAKTGILWGSRSRPTPLTWVISVAGWQA